MALFQFWSSRSKRSASRPSSRALTLLEDTQKELKKIKPEQTFDGDGKVLTEFYTKATTEARKKLTEKTARIEAALAQALSETPNFEKLFAATQGKEASSDE